MLRRILIPVALVGVAILVAAGCSEKYSAERDGKDLGEAVCDLRDADDAEDVQEARAEIDEKLNDLASDYALYTAEDREDIQNNLDDLAQHALDGDELLMQQDLTVLERSADNIADDVNETSEAAWEGFLQGISDCTQ